MVKTIEYIDGFARIIDQRVLPQQIIYFDIKNLEDGCYAIKDMLIRGAPAIGVCAAFTIAIECKNLFNKNKLNLDNFELICKILSKTRPTAVNLFIAIEYMKNLFTREIDLNDLATVVLNLEKAAIKFYEEDIIACKRMGEHGAKLLPSECTVITHCNAGGLATAGYGTALGVIRAAHSCGKKIKVFADETRPWFQGARLTAWELQEEGIDVTVITDSTAAFVMNKNKIDAVITGADRITLNGDAANKIGTYGLAISAKFHNVPFYIAAPTTTIDSKLSSGKDIPIEMRDTKEITEYKQHKIVADGIKAINPSFDVTPANLITNVITEKGVFEPSENGISKALK